MNVHFGLNAKGQVQPTTGFKITSGQQVAELPWFGNAHADYLLFHLVDDFIFSDADQEERRLAYHNKGVYGMGLNDETTVEDMEEYIYQCHN